MMVIYFQGKIEPKTYNSLGVCLNDSKYNIDCLSFDGCLFNATCERELNKMAKCTAHHKGCGCRDGEGEEEVDLSLADKGDIVHFRCGGKAEIDFITALTFPQRYKLTL